MHFLGDEIETQTEIEIDAEEERTAMKKMTEARVSGTLNYFFLFPMCCMVICDLLILSA